MRFKHLGVYLLLLVLLATWSPGATVPTEPVGSDNMAICILLGVSAGLAFASGNTIGLLGALVGAHSKGCF